MIQWMHALSKHWIVTLMMGALTLSFVVWGMGLDQFGIGNNSQVAKVGNTEISGLEFQRTYRNFLRNQSQRMGQDITPEMAEKMGLGQVALQQMVGRTAMQNEAERMGLITSDGAVVQNVRGMAPFRGTLGTFDRPTALLARRLYHAAVYDNIYVPEPNIPEAIGKLSRAIELDPGAFCAALELGNQYLRLRDREGALRAYRTSFEHAPQSDSIYDLLADQIRRVESEPLENIAALRNPGIE